MLDLLIDITIIPMMGAGGDDPADEAAEGPGCVAAFTGSVNPERAQTELFLWSRIARNRLSALPRRNTHLHGKHRESEKHFHSRSSTSRKFSAWVRVLRFRASIDYTPKHLHWSRLSHSSSIPTDSSGLGVCRNETQAAVCGIGFGAAPPPCFA